MTTKSSTVYFFPLSLFFTPFITLLLSKIVFKKICKLCFFLNRLVENRKIYVRRVASNVCDMIKSRPFVSPSSKSTGNGLFDSIIVVALFYDRKLQQYTPYIKSHYPSHVSWLLWSFLLLLVFSFGLGCWIVYFSGVEKALLLLFFLKSVFFRARSLFRMEWNTSVFQIQRIGRRPRNQPLSRTLLY